MNRIRQWRSALTMLFCPLSHVQGAVEKRANLTSPAPADKSAGANWERSVRDLRQQVAHRVRVQIHFK
jgi:hypothetical protein